MNRINQEMENKLKCLFPFLTVEQLMEEYKLKRAYNHLNISPFTKWLDEKEAKEKIIVFGNYRNNDEKEKFQKLEKAYLKAFEQIYKENELYLFVEELDENNQPYGNFYDLTPEEFIQAAISNIREEELFLIVIPNKKLLIQGDYDHTTICFYFDLDGRDYLERVFYSNGFYSLPG